MADGISVESKACETEEGDKPLIATWADDITVVANNRVTAAKVIATQERIST